MTQRRADHIVPWIVSQVRARLGRVVSKDDGFRIQNEEFSIKKRGILYSKRWTDSADLLDASLAAEEEHTHLLQPPPCAFEFHH